MKYAHPDISRFISRPYLSRLAIIGLDSLASVVSFFVASVLRYNFELDKEVFVDAAYQLPILILARLVFFKFFKTYSGIIKYTGEKDAKRMLAAISSSSAMLVFLNAFWSQFQEGYLFSYSILLIEYFITLFVLIFYRLATKTFYFSYLYQEPETKVENVVIFGAGRSGFITKRTLSESGQAHKNVVAFFDDDPALHRKLLDGVMIYEFTKKNLENIVKKHNVQQAIISVQAISGERRKAIVDHFLDQKLKVMQVPSAEKWVHGELSVKQIKEINIEDLLNREPIKLNSENISKEVIGKRILVTGAAGSIGSELVRQLVKFAPNHIYLLDNAESPLVEIDLEIREQFGFNNVTPIIGDVSDKPYLEQQLARHRPEIIFHAAAYKHVPVMERMPSMAAKVNIMGTKNLADLAVSYKVKKFVMVSTDKAVNPTNVMGASKRVAEIYTQSLNNHKDVQTRFITTRFGNVLGSNGSVIPRFSKQIEKGGPITVTHPEITRYFMTIPEACQLVLEAASMGNGGEIYLFDMGKAVKILDLAKNMIKLAGNTPEVDIPISFTGLRPGEKIHEELLAQEENQVKTHHKKITIARVREYPYKVVNEQIETMLEEIYNNNAYALVGCIKKLVPEFISNNSQFSSLDKRNNGDSRSTILKNLA